MVAFSSRMSGLAGRLRPLPGRARVAGFRHSPAGRAVQWVHRRVSAVNKAGGSKTKGGEGDRVRPRRPPLPGGFVALPQLVFWVAPHSPCWPTVRREASSFHTESLKAMLVVDALSLGSRFSVGGFTDQACY